MGKAGAVLVDHGNDFRAEIPSNCEIHSNHYIEMSRQLFYKYFGLSSFMGIYHIN